MARPWMHRAALTHNRPRHWAAEHSQALRMALLRLGHPAGHRVGDGIVSKKAVGFTGDGLGFGANRSVPPRGAGAGSKSPKWGLENIGSAHGCGVSAMTQREIAATVLGDGGKHKTVGNRLLGKNGELAKTTQADPRLRSNPAGGEGCGEAEATRSRGGCGKFSTSWQGPRPGRSADGWEVALSESFHL